MSFKPEFRNLRVHRDWNLFVLRDKTSGNSCDPNWLDCVVYTPFDTDLNDKSLWQRVGTVIAQASVDTVNFKYGGGSLLVDGLDDKVRLLVGPECDFGTGDFTFSLWVYPKAYAEDSFLVEYNNSFGGKSWSFYLQKSTGIVCWLPESESPVVFSDAVVSLNIWTSLVIVRSGGVMRVYLNGVQMGSGVSDTRNYRHFDTRIIRIGSDTGGGNGLNGNIDDLQIHKRAVWTADFPPPPAYNFCPPFPAYFNVPLTIDGNDIVQPYAVEIIDGAPTFSENGMLCTYLGDNVGVRFRGFAQEPLNEKIDASNRAEGLNYRVDVSTSEAGVMSTVNPALFRMFDLFGSISFNAGPSQTVVISEVNTLFSYVNEITVPGIFYGENLRLSIRYQNGSNFAQMYINDTLVYTSVLNYRITGGLLCGVYSSAVIRSYTFKNLVMERV